MIARRLVRGMLRQAMKWWQCFGLEGWRGGAGGFHNFVYLLSHHEGCKVARVRHLIVSDVCRAPRQAESTRIHCRAPLHISLKVLLYGAVWTSFSCLKKTRMVWRPYVQDAQAASDSAAVPGEGDDLCASSQPSFPNLSCRDHDVSRSCSR
jgi:hypothetical protein